MDNTILTKEALDLVKSEFFIFLVVPTVQQLIFDTLAITRTQKYNGYMIANGECLKDIRERMPTQQEKYDYKGKYKEKIDKIIEYFDSKDLEGLYRNLATAKIGRTPLTMLIMTSGAYVPFLNAVGYTSKKSFTHEILHMASTYRDKMTKVEFSGFCQRKGLIKLAAGLNEGYTELLASRVENRKVHSYHSESRFANMIEYFFDDPKEMESLYMNHDLPGLAKHMSKFASEKEFLNMVYSIEFSRGLGLPLPPITMVLAKVKLYEWFTANCKDETKLAEFEKLAFQDKMVEMIIKKKKMKLSKGGKSLPFNSSDLELESIEDITPKDEQKSISDKYKEFVYARRQKIMEYECERSIRTQDYIGKTK